MADTLRETPANPELAVSTSTSAGTLQRLSAMVLIVLPFVGFVWATAWAWDDGVSRTALVVAVGMYLVTGHGVSVGFHRMLTHRSLRRAGPSRSRWPSPGRWRRRDRSSPGSPNIVATMRMPTRGAIPILHGPMAAVSAPNFGVCGTRTSAGSSSPTHLIPSGGSPICFPTGTCRSSRGPRPSGRSYPWPYRHSSDGC